MKKTIITIMAILLFSTVLIAEIVDTDPSFSIKSDGYSWKVIKHDGIEADYFTSDYSIAGNNIKYCLYPRETLSANDPVVLNMKSYYRQNGNLIEQSSLVVEKDGPSVKSICVEYDKSTVDWIQFGENSSVVAYQEDSKVVYDNDNYQVNVTLYKYVEDDWVIAPDQIFINSTNEDKLKFGAYDNYSKDTTLYKYVFISNRQIDSSYRISEGTSLKINQFFSKPQYRQIDTSDICIENANCTFNLTHQYENITIEGIEEEVFSKSTLEVPFYAFYNATEDLIFIDPAFTLTYDSSDDIIFNNATEGSNNGARLDAPILFMDFDNEPENNPWTSYTNGTVYAQGNYTQDNSIYNNYGSTTGMTDWRLIWDEGNITGRNVLEFDGTNDYVNVPYTNDLFLNETATINLWVNPDKTDTNQAPISTYGDGSVSVGWGLQTHGTAQWRFYSIGDWGTYNCYSNNNEVIADEWNMITIQKNHSNVTLYRNGVDITSATCVTFDLGLFPTNDINIGEEVQNSRNFDGQIGDVLLLNRSLEAWEITDLYTNQSKGELTNLTSDANITGFWGLNETSGLTAYDFTERNNGTLTNYGLTDDSTPLYNTTCDSPAGGNCYTFDGVDDYIDLGNPDSLDIDSAVTMSMWVYRSSSDTARSEFIRKNNNYIMRLESDDLRFVYWTNDGNRYIYDGPELSKNNWNHIAISVSSNFSNAIWYVNGVNVTTTVSSASFSSNFNSNIYIGKDADTTPLYKFNGSIDQIQVWDRALSAEEILRLNNSFDIGKYSKEGDFKSLVYYNETDSNWNITLSTADTYSNRTGVVNANGSINISDPDLKGYWSLDRTLASHNGSNNFSLTAGGKWFNSTGLTSDAIDFDGSIGALIATYPTSGNNNVSISCWFRMRDQSSHRMICGSQSMKFSHVPSGSRTIRLATTDEGASTGTIMDSTTLLDQDTWYHVAGTYNGSRLTMYINGEFEKLTDEDPVQGLRDNFYNFLLGDSGALLTTYGTVDEASYWSKELSAQDVRNLYKSGLSQIANTNITLETRTATSYNTSDEDLILHYAFEDDLDDSLNNYNSFNISGTYSFSNDGSVLGNGVELDGIINLTTNAKDDGYANMTVSFWVTPRELAANNFNPVALFGSKKATFRKEERAITQYTDNTNWYFRLYYDDGDIIDSNGKVEAEIGKTYHMVGIWEANNHAWFYINGELIGNKTSVYPQNPAFDYYLGNYNNHDTLLIANMAALYDELRIYNRSLTQAEVTDLYNLGKSNIEWGNWTDEGVMQDNVIKDVTSRGNYMQFKAKLSSDNTNVSPYIINYSINQVTYTEPTPEPNVTTTEEPAPTPVAGGTFGSLTSKCDQIADVYDTCYFLNIENYCVKGCPTDFSCNEETNRCEATKTETGECKEGYKLENGACVPDKLQQIFDPITKKYKSISDKYFAGKGYILPIFILIIGILYYVLFSVKKQKFKKEVRWL